MTFHNYKMRIIKLLFLGIILITSCQNIKSGNQKYPISNKPITEKKHNNKSVVNIRGNIYEVTQAFVNKNEEETFLGEKVDLDLKNSEGAMISAYSLETGDYQIFFRTLEYGNWSEWVNLEENPEVINPNRRAFTPKSLNNNVSKIQFKSDQRINEVFFRVYAFIN